MAGFVRSRIRPTRLPQIPTPAEGLQVLADVTGGLDLDADGFEVEGNKTFDILNYDPLPQGGVRMRDTVAPFNTNDLAARPGALSFYEGDSSWMLASINNQVWSCGGPGQSFSLEAITGTSPSWLSTSDYQWRCTQANGYGYLQNGWDAPRRWFPGSPVVTLTQNFNENLEAPTTGNMPIGRYCAMHLGHFWVAFTREGGVEYPDRLRWSHPVVNGAGQECYRSTDKVELDQGADGEYITALLPGGTELWVFKQHSCYQLSGVDVTDFLFTPVSRDVGAAGPNAVACRGDRVWFWDSREGLHTLEMASQGIRYGVSLVPVTGPLIRLFRDHLVDQGQAHNTHVGCVGNRVFVSVPCIDGRRLFVFDPNVGEKGAWTEYGLQLGNFFDWTPFQNEAMPVAVQFDENRPNRVLRLDVEGDTDDFGNGVEANVRTHWFTPQASAQQPLFLKRWQSLELVIEGDATITCQVHVDWASNISQTVVFPVPPRHDTLIIGVSILPPIPQERVRPTAEPTSIPNLTYASFPQGFVGESDRPRIRVDRERLNVPVSRVCQLRVSGPSQSVRHTVRGLGLRWLVSPRRTT